MAETLGHMRNKTTVDLTITDTYDHVRPGNFAPDRKIMAVGRFPNLFTYFLLLFLFFAKPDIVPAQGKEVTRDNQQWLQYYLQTKLNHKWVWLSDVGYRGRDGLQESTQYIIRTAIGYAVTSDIRISTGLAHVGFYSSGTIQRVEFRPYQEISMKNTFGKIELNHRYRIEERFFNPVENGKIETPNSFNFRFRYLVMVGVPLFRLSKEKPEKIFLINMGDEIFINAGKGIVHNVFDQNRLIISPTFKLNEQLSLSLTWNSQFAKSSTQASYTHSDVIWLQVRHNLDLGKRK